MIRVEQLKLKLDGSQSLTFLPPGSSQKHLPTNFSVKVLRKTLPQFWEKLTLNQMQLSFHLLKVISRKIKLFPSNLTMFQKKAQ